MCKKVDSSKVYTQLSSKMIVLNVMKRRQEGEWWKESQEAIVASIVMSQCGSSKKKMIDSTSAREKTLGEYSMQNDFLWYGRYFLQFKGWTIFFIFIFYNEKKNLLLSWIEGIHHWLKRNFGMSSPSFSVFRQFFQKKKKKKLL